MCWPALVQAMSRLRTNAGYFRINYLVFLMLSTLTVMLMNPSSLFVLGGLGAGWVYLYAVRTAPVVIGERTLRWVPLCNPPPLLRRIIE